MLDTFAGKLIRIICFVIEPNNCGNSKFFEDGDIVIRGKCTILVYEKVTPYLSVVF